MALPTLVKTWQYSVNNVQTIGATVEESVDKLLLQIKNSLIGFASSPWTVVGSSNGTAAGMDAVDRWSTVADLVHAYAGTAHSWIVLKQAALSGSNFQLLISCDNSGAYTCSFRVSYNDGFTGGSVTDDPTATDSHTIKSGTQIFPNSTFRSILHASQASDGTCTRLVWCYSNTAIGFLAIETLNNAVAGMTRPVAVLCQANYYATPTLTRGAFETSGYGVFFRQASTNRNGSNYLTEEYCSSSPLGVQFNSVANEISSEWPISPMGLASTATGVRGRHGSFYDLFWGTNNHAVGTTYPLDGSKQFVQFDEFVFPWNGTAPLLT